MGLRSTLFLSEETLKANSILSENVDMKHVTPSIQYVQDSLVQPLVGTKLYRELQRQVFEDDFKPDYKDLLDDFIEPILIYGTLAEVPDDLLFKMMNLTVGSTADEGITSATLRQASYIKEGKAKKMQFYAKRLIDYLRWNTQKFPEYLNNEEDDMRPEHRAYTSGIAMPSISRKDFKGPIRYNDIVIDILSTK